MKLLIIIPAYNEAESLKGVIERLRSTCPQYDYIIVNDGSTDGTTELCEENNYNIINHTANEGLSGAIHTGMKYAIENGYDAALQFDADGQHLSEYINSMVNCMKESGCDIVIGSRFLNSKMPFRLRTLGGKIIFHAVRHAANAELSDPTSGMRLFSADIMSLFIENKHFTPEPDTLAFLIRMGADIREVKVTMEDRMAGQSYLTPINATKYMFKMIKSILYSQKRWQTVEIPGKKKSFTTKIGG